MVRSETAQLAGQGACHGDRRDAGRLADELAASTPSKNSTEDRGQTATDRVIVPATLNLTFEDLYIPGMNISGRKKQTENNKLTNLSINIGIIVNIYSMTK